MTTCDKCWQTLEMHVLYGHRAYCGLPRSEHTLGSFTVAQVNNMRRTLGNPVGLLAQDLERREALADW